MIYPVRPADLDGLLAHLPPAEKLLLQERVGGRLIGLALVISRDASAVARFQQVAHRTWPPPLLGRRVG
ncbi:MAG: hypothetical protein ACYDHH_23340 [Solirubrobacteraceae bacterium]